MFCGGVSISVQLELCLEDYILNCFIYSVLGTLFLSQMVGLCSLCVTWVARYCTSPPITSERMEMTRSALSAEASPLHHCVIRWLLLNDNLEEFSFSSSSKTVLTTQISRILKSPESLSLQASCFWQVFFPNSKILESIRLVKQKMQRKIMLNTWQSHYFKLCLKHSSLPCFLFLSRLNCAVTKNYFCGDKNVRYRSDFKIFSIKLSKNCYERFYSQVLNVASKF